ncbi:MAG TPA: VCBS repeat-containing protein [Pyrinomonadaceae bacterium]
MKRVLVFLICLALLLIGLTPLSSANKSNQNSSVAALNPLLSESPFSSKGLLRARRQEEQGDLSTIAGSGQTIARSGVVTPHVVKGVLSKNMPISMHRRIREWQEAEERGEPIVPIAKGPAARPGPTSLETIAPKDAAQRGSAPNAAPLAPNDLVVFRQHDMTPAEAPTGDRSSIAEPSTISVGNAVFYTSNWFAARSTDGGQTFSYVDPYATFPSVNGGFCCDQVTAYAPTQDMALWGLQYVQSASGGTFRIARTIGSAGIASNVWTYYNFNPQNFGFAAGAWMDFPNMSVSATYVYASSNVFTSGGSFAGNVIWRVPLSELAAGGSVNYNYLMRTDINSIRLVEGAGTTMYWAAFLNSTQMRIHRWDDGSTSVNWDDISLNSFTYLARDGVSTTIDGRNWAARADSRPLGAYVANGVIGVMWMAKQDGSFPHPYTIHARFNQSTRALITQQQIWNSGFAWLYPNVTVNAAGNLGGIIAYGGGSTYYPSSAFWVVDDVATALPLGENLAAITGNAGPSNNAWGDYLSVHRHSLYPNTWVAATYALSGGTPVPRFVWFGRQRDVSTGPTSRAVSDFDGDLKSDVAVFRQSNGGWYLSQSSAGFAATGFGANGDKAVPADYDGDGKTDIAVFRPSTGAWYLLRSQLGFTGISFGTNGDMPAVGDFDGDGKADIAVFRPSTGAWYIQRSQLGFIGLSFGTNGDTPAVGDYDGDGKADVAVFRQSTGAWYIQRSQLGFTGLAFGANGDKPTPADYDGDGKTDVAVFRPSNGGWYLQRSQLGFTALLFGANGDKPAPGDYDGDGKADVAVFRPSNGTWYIQRSQQGFFGQAFGTNGDVPAAGAYIP